MPEDGTAPAHPLDPLTAAEIRQVTAAVRRGHAAGPAWRFASIELDEPAKERPAGPPAPRTAEAV